MSAVQCINIADILDGIHMTEKQLHPARNPVWMQTVICLAVFMYIPSMYEVYHLRFLELTTGSNSQKRNVNFLPASCSLFYDLCVLWTGEA